MAIGADFRDFNSIYEAGPRPDAVYTSGPRDD
jgi:hypothetical protein